ncbi:hypothetical protein DFH27DRAFT_347178 [Peziza echinospora]|nr:hypothetical protein DFH27DRAFT_347178 [Peziza echinospora]
MQVRDIDGFPFSLVSRLFFFGLVITLSGSSSRADPFRQCSSDAVKCEGACMHQSKQHEGEKKNLPAGGFLPTSRSHQAQDSSTAPDRHRYSTRPYYPSIVLVPQSMEGVKSKVCNPRPRPHMHLSLNDKGTPVTG